MDVLTPNACLVGVICDACVYVVLKDADDKDDSDDTESKTDLDSVSVV